MAKYICTGTCGGSVSEEEYAAGKTTCGTPGCTHEGHTFERQDEAAGEEKAADSASAEDNA